MDEPILPSAADEWQEIKLFGCTVLGGAALSFPPGTLVTLGFQHSLLAISSDLRVEQFVLYPEIVSIAITGPGRVTTGGGIIGGGFGVEGALEGIAIASILNSLTTRTQIHTIIEIIAHRGELFLHYGGMEPGAARIALSPVFTRLRELDSSWISERLSRLSSLRDRGILSVKQFERLSQELTASASPIIETPAKGLTRSDLEKLSRALCPNCDAYNAFRTEPGSVVCEVCGKTYPVTVVRGVLPPPS